VFSVELSGSAAVHNALLSIVLEVGKWTGQSLTDFFPTPSHVVCAHEGCHCIANYSISADAPTIRPADVTTDRLRLPTPSRPGAKAWLCSPTPHRPIVLLTRRALKVPLIKGALQVTRVLVVRRPLGTQRGIVRDALTVLISTDTVVIAAEKCRIIVIAATFVRCQRKCGEGGDGMHGETHMYR